MGQWTPREARGLVAHRFGRAGTCRWAGAGSVLSAAQARWLEPWAEGLALAASAASAASVASARAALTWALPSLALAWAALLSASAWCDSALSSDVCDPALPACVPESSSLPLSLARRFSCLRAASGGQVPRWSRLYWGQAEAPAGGLLAFGVRVM
jgi:hypothetical protein